MSLAIGTRLGPYEIVAAIGAGGMGEVYRATDGNLKRSVAIKVLPASVAGDTDRLARFQREAEVLAALNHPNIAAIYGLEKTPELTALVMELVEGEDLSAQIARGAMPLADALPIAKQIADALEAAHEQGIVHRDLKPQNIKVRTDGTVKVLDFGLAKAMDPAGSSGADLMNSPTLTARATAMGMIIGTAAYMAPEQARGRAVDKRADIWAFGAVLYEMLTGRRAFDPSGASGSSQASSRSEGDTVTDVLAAVLRQDIDWTTLPAGTPPRLRQLLERCLERDIKMRLRDIGEARVEITKIQSGALDRTAIGTMGGVASGALRAPASRWLIALLAVATLGFAALAASLWASRAEPASPPTHLSIALPDGHSIISGPAISNDGRHVAFVSSDGVGRPQLYVRSFDEADSRLLKGTEEADDPFFSPDGQWIAFYARQRLFKVRIDGGEPVPLAASSSHHGGTWTDAGTIIFNKTWNGGLEVVSENGGESKPFLTLDSADEYAYVWPYAMPGGGKLLFNDWGKKFNTYILDTKTMTKRVVADFWRRLVYVPTGHLIGADDGGELRAVSLAEAGDAGGNVTTVVKGVDIGSSGGDARFDVSQSGTLAYVRKETGRRSLVIVDQHGQATGVPTPEGEFDGVRVSPDGRRVAVMANLVLTIVDLDRGTTTPLVPELDGSGGARSAPVWSLDGRSVTFASNHEGNWNIYSKAATGAGQIVSVLKRPLDQNPQAYAPDGTLLFNSVDRQEGTELWMLPPGPPSPEARVWLSNNAVNGDARFSPDGHLVAYDSDSSGRSEVYIQSRDNAADRAQVSVAGGTMPVWSRAGDRLYFRQGNLIMEAAIRTTGGLSATPPVRLFDGGWTLAQWYPFDVLPDGRLLMVEQARESIPTRIDVVLNWFTTLKQAVAGSR